MFSWCRVGRRWPGSQCRWRLRSALRSYTTWPSWILPLSSSAASHNLACKCPPSSTPGCWGLGTPGSEETEWENKLYSVESAVSGLFTTCARSVSVTSSIFDEVLELSQTKHKEQYADLWCRCTDRIVKSRKFPIPFSGAGKFDFPG